MSTATKMVFRFTEGHDKELMREVIAQKPFEAKYGDAARVWTHVAERVSTAIQTKVVEKQVRGRELRSALGSKIEESRDAVNEQSHYETLAGLVGQYVSLEDAFKDDKKERAKEKKADEASATRCASEIVEEAIVRRALRAEDYESTSSVSDNDDIDDVASPSSTPSKPRRTKRKNAFQQEAEWQEKRLRADMELRRQQFEQQIQERAEERNGQLIFECVKVLSDAFTSKKK
ncbi:hypothetical protein P3T76_016046 [Phytophthora citrophthora]|uniref:Uncharacterized protein n=1 Tax=Phytophthora citrophthora TaxID=4793 RepID=A0AAD9FYE9_9STRA|nr:hypothetical protein P3T76_016046 [Phytophthora citrophthora]